MRAFVLPLQLYTEVAIALLAVLLGGPLVYALHSLFLQELRARRARRIFEAQGVKCLPRRAFLNGNLQDFAVIFAKARSQPMSEISHAVAPRIMPHVYEWRKTYGEHFTYWFGLQPRYVLKEPEQAKELLSTKSGHFKKPGGRPDTKDLVGDGLVSLDGERWAQHRRILNPAFFLDKLKAMAPTMGGLTVKMMKTWGSRVERKDAIDVAEEFRNLTADIISHTAFGSSFAEGKLVFEMQHKQQELISKMNAVVYIPGSRFLPTSQNWYRNSLKYGIHDVLGQIIQKRMKSGDRLRTDGYGNDLLGLMLAANKGELHGNQKNLTMGLDELIDECKTFFFAGHETTATLLTFMFLLLANHPEWQERLREEVFDVCGRTDLPTADSLNHLKLVGMVINESLRLYPPASLILRKAENDMKLGETLIPAGTTILVPIIAWHHDERYWGADADEFRPERFEEGIAKACKVPGAFLPFSFGPRNCIGQVFATIEAKMVLSTILQQYRFRLSPDYVHAPTMVLTTRPQFGMPIIFEDLEQLA
ncbi:hypothetical protein GOP47_0009083 [Adiantum capillus-veneris]|uniref:Cytochrome P450 n=1 Tax=Adiantum capillus-veneris TaxID=13818 RepID=A0A9D4ZIM4_ADICA|nr:hypothetical protein GOP47_0009083 [Adiantum capillus-veneris]